MYHRLRWEVTFSLFLLCDVDQVDSELIGWSDAYSTYDAHNIIYDVPKVATAKYQIRDLRTDNSCVSDNFVDDEVVEIVDDSGPPIFAIVKSWVKPVGKLGDRKGNRNKKEEDEISVDEFVIEEMNIEML